MKKRMKGCLSILLIIAMLSGALSAGSTLTCRAAALPGIKDTPTEENVLALLDAYFPDGAYILRAMKKKGDNWLKNYFPNGYKLTACIGTAVHEENHGFTYVDKSLKKFRYYTKNKKAVNVTVGKLYRTKKMAASIPKNLRSLRYNVYVNVPKKDENWITSNKCGIYGLMDEFNAYRMGLGTDVGLEPYYEQNALEDESWWLYISYGSDCKLAYAEFKYYILHYLSYAKKKYPEVYRSVLANKSFRRAYRLTEKDFSKKVSQFDAGMQQIVDTAASKSGGTASITQDEVRITKGSTTTIRSISGGKDYTALMEELEKPGYKKLHKLLAK